MAENGQNTPNPTRAIASEAIGTDMFLLVGTPPWEFAAQSTKLTAASHVFRAMLSGDWAEGKPETGDWKVSLPEEDPALFGLLLTAIHRSTNADTYSLPPKEANLKLREFAALDNVATKYFIDRTLLWPYLFHLSPRLISERGVNGKDLANLLRPYLGQFNPKYLNARILKNLVQHTTISALIDNIHVSESHWIMYEVFRRFCVFCITFLEPHQGNDIREEMILVQKWLAAWMLLSPNDGRLSVVQSVDGRTIESLKDCTVTDLFRFIVRVIARPRRVTPTGQDRRLLGHKRWLAERFRTIGFVADYASLPSDPWMRSHRPAADEVCSQFPWIMWWRIFSPAPRPA